MFWKMHAPNPECPNARTLKSVLNPLHPGPVRSTGCPPGGPREVPKRWCPACYHSKPAEKCVPRVKECPCVEGTEVTGPAASYFSYFPAARVDVQGDLSLFSFFFPLSRFLFPFLSPLLLPFPISLFFRPVAGGFWAELLDVTTSTTILEHSGAAAIHCAKWGLRAMSGWLATGLRQLY
jgi:hypothetical protein